MNRSGSTPGTIEYTKGIRSFMSTERSVSRDGDKVYLDVENDGWTYMNRGPEARRTEIISADEKGLRLVDGSVVSSSDGHLQKEAMRYFAEIANESKGR
jgi:hypothetical protein